MATTSVTKTPYKGLIPYSAEDAAYFFGREQEQNIITANLLSERLTLLYGASGVGKSSVLRAGVEHHLKQLARQNIKNSSKPNVKDSGKPKYVVAVFNDWRDSDPLQSLLKKVGDAVRQTLEGQTVAPVGPSLTLSEALLEWARRAKGQLLIILDQFEEYFLYHQNEDGPGTFATEFPNVVNNPALPVNFIVSFREDALAKLDFFKVRMPGLFGNFLRIDHLSREGGEAAIKGPLERYNQQIKNNGLSQAVSFEEVGIEEDLVSEVLKQVKVGEKLIGEGGLGGIEKQAEQAGSRWQIETPYLQLVMTRIWEEEEARLKAQQQKQEPKKSEQKQVLTLRSQTLTDLRGAKHIVQTHLDTIMQGLPKQERDLGAKIFNHLVTPSGTKIAQTVPDLAHYVELSPAKEAQLAKMMEWLSSGDKRIFRVLPPPAHQKDSPRYEVFHDVLAQAILDWRRRHSERQRRNRWAVGAGALAVLLVMMTALTVYAFNQKAIAEEAQYNANQQREIADRQKEIAESEKARAAREADFARENARKAGQSAQLAREESEKASQQAQLAKTEAGRANLQTRIASAARAEANRLAAEARANERRALEAEVREKARADEALRERIRAEASEKEALFARQEAEQQKLVASLERNRQEQLLKAIREIDQSTPYYKAVLRGHEGSVLSASFSNDARKVMTYSDDKSAIVWDAETGEKVSRIIPDKGNIVGVTFSPDEKFVAINELDDELAGTVTIWDVSGGDPKKTDLRQIINKDGLVDTIYNAQFSSDGKLLLAAGESGVRVWKWDAVTGKLDTQALSFAGDAITAVFSADGKYVLSIGDTLDIWDAATGNKLKSVPGDADSGSPMSFSPGGKYVIVPGYGVLLWDIERGANIDFAPGKKFSLAAVSPDEKYLAAVEKDEFQAQLFDIDRPREPKTLSGHAGYVSDVQFSPDGKYVVTSSADKTARVWDLNGNLVAELRGHTGGVNSIAFDPQGRYVLTSSDDRTARVWDLGKSIPTTDSLGADIGLQTSFNFDKGRGIVETKPPAEDIRWEEVSGKGENFKQLRPLNGARIVRVVPDIKYENLTITQLQGLNYSNVTLIGSDDASNQLSAGTVFAVLTNEGNYAKAKVDRYGTNLRITWLTYFNARGLAVSASDKLSAVRADLDNPASKDASTASLQRMVAALERDAEIAPLLVSANVNSKDEDGLKLLSALIEIRRSASLQNNEGLLNKVNRAIVEDASSSGVSTTRLYTADVESLKALELLCESDEAYQLSQIRSLTLTQADKQSATTATYKTADDFTKVGYLTLTEYTDEADAASQIAAHEAAQEKLLLKGEAYVQGRAVKVLVFRARLER